MALNSLFCADVPLSNYSLTSSDRYCSLTRNCWPNLRFFQRQGMFDAFIDRPCIHRLISSLLKLVYTLRTAPKDVDLLWKLLILFVTSVAIRLPFVTAQNNALSGISRDTRWLFNVRDICCCCGDGHQCTECRQWTVLYRWTANTQHWTAASGELSISGRG